MDGFLCTYVLQSSVLLMVGLLLPRFNKVLDPRIWYIYYHLVLSMVLFCPLFWSVYYSEQIFNSDCFGLLIDFTSSSYLFTSIILVFLVAIMRLVRVARNLWSLTMFRVKSKPFKATNALIKMQSNLASHAICALSDLCKLPMTFGWRKPIVLLPPDIDSFSECQQKVILCHEFLHIKRRDWLIYLLEEIFISVFWFHPAIWIMRNKIDLCREQTVDMDVVQTVGNKLTYMNVLKEFASRQLELACTISNKGQLVERIRLLAAYNKIKSKSKTKLTIIILVLFGSFMTAGILGAKLIQTTLML